MASPTPLPVAPVALVPGDAMPEGNVGPLTITDFVRYAGAGGDMNPLHHDDQAARDAGMPGVFAMGLLHAGMLGNRVARWVGPLNIRAFSVRFTGQVWPGDVLTFTGSVVSVEGEEAQLEMQVTRQGGDVVLRSHARATVASAYTAPVVEIPSSPG
jgi:acyl dehydratase